MKKGTITTIILICVLLLLFNVFQFLQNNNNKQNIEVLLKNNEINQEAFQIHKNKMSKLELEYMKVTHELSELKKKNSQYESLQKERNQLITQSSQLKSKIEELEEIIKKKNSIRNQNSTNATKTAIKKNKVAYLTFDDGPSDNTVKILEILKKQNIKATFFVNGKTDKKSIEIYKNILSNGHAIGNHTYSHNYSRIYSSTDNFMNDQEKLNQLLEKELNYKTNLLRFPGGSNNTVSNRYGGKDFMHRLITEINKTNLKYIDWNVDSKDATGNNVSKEKIVQSVLNGSKHKDKIIVLMHDSKPKKSTVEGLSDIIVGLRQEGFTFEALTEQSFNSQFVK